MAEMTLMPTPVASCVHKQHKREQRNKNIAAFEFDRFELGHSVPTLNSHKAHTNRAFRDLDYPSFLIYLPRCPSSIAFKAH